MEFETTPIWLTDRWIGCPPKAAGTAQLSLVQRTPGAALRTVNNEGGRPAASRPGSRLFPAVVDRRSRPVLLER